MKAKSILVLVALCLMFGAGSSRASLLGGYYLEKFIQPEYTPFPLDDNFQLFIGPFDEGRIIGGEYAPAWGPLIEAPFTSADVGTTWTVNSGWAYNVAVASLTNGTLDSMSWATRTWGMGGPEDSFWSVHNVEEGSHSITSHYAGTNGLDFAGFDIDHISFRLDAFGLRHLAFAVEVFSTPTAVPVPSAVLLGLLGLGCLHWRRRRPAR